MKKNITYICIVLSFTLLCQNVFLKSLSAKAAVDLCPNKVGEIFGPTDDYHEVFKINACSNITDQVVGCARPLPGRLHPCLETDTLKCLTIPGPQKCCCSLTKVSICDINNCGAIGTACPNNQYCFDSSLDCSCQNVCEDRPSESDPTITESWCNTIVDGNCTNQSKVCVETGGHTCACEEPATSPTSPTPAPGTTTGTTTPTTSPTPTAPGTTVPFPTGP